MKISRISSILFVLLMSIIFSLACQTLKEQEARDTLSIQLSGGNLDKAEEYLRLDDYRLFQKAEVHFLMLRLKERENVHIAGWLTQLYVAWVEQLRSEINLLKWKLAAARATRIQGQQSAIFALIDYRQHQLEEAEEGARSLGNVLIQYDSGTYIGHRAMADYFRIMGDRQKMEERLGYVERLNPDSNGARFIKGAAAAQFDKDYKTAIKYYREAYKKDPMFIKSRYYEGIALHHLGKDDEAKVAMHEVLAKSPNHPGARSFLASEEYIDSLSEEAKARLAEDRIDYSRSQAKPQLITWIAQWAGRQPDMKYRISGLPDRDVPMKVVLNLIDLSGKVVETHEYSSIIRAGKFTDGGHVFRSAFDQTKDEVNILIQLLAQLPEEDKYSTVDVRQVSLVPLRD